LLATHIRPAIGVLWVDRTRTDRIERVFAHMGDAVYATSTVDHTWDYLNQACRHALRQQRIKRNPVQDVLLPEARPAKERKTLTIEQARRILFDAIPDDRNPAMWLTGLMCGLRPGELAGCAGLRRHRWRRAGH
jgi:integrase